MSLFDPYVLVLLRGIERHVGLFYFILFYFIFFCNVYFYFWDRERQSMNGGGAEREGDTEPETGPRL